jgi:hypothetical protein
VEEPLSMIDIEKFKEKVSGILNSDYMITKRKSEVFSDGCSQPWSTDGEFFSRQEFEDKRIYHYKSTIKSFSFYVDSGKDNISIQSKLNKFLNSSLFYDSGIKLDYYKKNNPSFIAPNRIEFEIFSKKLRSSNFAEIVPPNETPKKHYFASMPDIQIECTGHGKS